MPAARPLLERAAGAIEISPTHAQAFATVAAARSLERIADRLDTICEILSSPGDGSR